MQPRYDDLAYRCDKYAKFLKETGLTQAFLRWKMKEIGMAPRTIEEGFSQVTKKVTYPTAETALGEIESVSDNCVNAEVYTTADALADLQEIRNIIRRYHIRHTSVPRSPQENASE